MELGREDSRNKGNTRETGRGNSLEVQWLGLRASTAGGTGLVPGWGTKIPPVTWLGKQTKKRNRKACVRDYKQFNIA